MKITDLKEMQNLTIETMIERTIIPYLESHEILDVELDTTEPYYTERANWLVIGLNCHILYILKHKFGIETFVIDGKEYQSDSLGVLGAIQIVFRREFDDWQREHSDTAKESNKEIWNVLGDAFGECYEHIERIDESA